MKQTEKMISVIVPIYNGADYVQGMIDMLKAQTYRCIEVIIVDDGSTDDTLAECRRLTQGNSSFQVVSKQNGGVSSARNYGMKKSKGDYIAFIDADDYIYPSYLEKLYSIMTKYNADWSQCSFIKVKENYKLDRYEGMRTDMADKNILLFDKKTAMRDFAYRRHITGSACLKLIKREIAEQIDFREDLRYSEDYSYIYELIKKTDHVVYIDSVEYLYIQRKESAIHMKRKSALEYQKGWEQLKKIYAEVMKTMPYAGGGYLKGSICRQLRTCLEFMTGSQIGTI